MAIYFALSEAKKEPRGSMIYDQFWLILRAEIMRERDKGTGAAADPRLIRLHEAALGIMTGKMDIEMPPGDPEDTIDALGAAMVLGAQELQHRIKEAERLSAELRDSRDQTRALLTAVPDDIVLLSSDGVVLDVSLHGDKGYFSELNAAQLIGARFESLELLGTGAYFSEWFAEVRECLQIKVMRQSRGAQHFEHRIVPFVVRGRLSRLVVCIRNISDEVVLANERQAFELQAFQRHKMESMGMMAGGLAHEINNPLAFVLSNLTQLKETWATESPEQGTPEMDSQLVALEDALVGAERIKRLMDDFRVFSRPAEAKNGTAELNRAIESALRLAANQLRHSCQVTFTPVDDVFVTGSETKLSQVFLNLLINAAHAFPHDQSENSWLDVQLISDGSRAKVIVCDNGRGMSQEEVDSVFTPFYSTKGPESGTGLGLSICRSIVTDAGGTIELQSELTKGTSAIVVLPCCAPPLARSVNTHELAEITLRPNLRILAVDDEAPVLRALKRCLRKHQFVGVTSARMAVSEVEKEPFDVILCDLMMPGMNGIDLYNELKKSRPEQAKKMIVVTGGAFTTEGKEFLESSGVPCLSKPFENHELLGVVASMASQPESPLKPGAKKPREDWEPKSHAV